MQKCNNADFVVSQRPAITNCEAVIPSSYLLLLDLCSSLQLLRTLLLPDLCSSLQLLRNLLLPDLCSSLQLLRNLLLPDLRVRKHHCEPARRAEKQCCG